MPLDGQKTGANVGKVKVWDLPTRLFHWALVGTITFLLWTGFLAPEWWQDRHVLAGYVLMGLIGFRLVWGVFGNGNARFKSFAYGPGAIIEHLKGILARKPGHFLGHNPAGGAMIFALLGLVGLLCISGLIVLGGQEKLGPLAFAVSFATGHDVKEAHEVMAILLMVLIGGHLTGVLVESLLSRENLPRAMVTGEKRWPGQATLPVDAGRPVLGLLLTAAIIGAGGVAFAGLSDLPAKGVPTMAANPQYAKDCGDCHMAFPPSLLPESSWRQLMDNLDDHFGEDASLPPETTQDLTDWLTTWSAERWDLESANRLRRVSAEHPYQITETPFWTRKHRDIPKDTFKTAPVKSKANCAACHGDAKTGRFADAEIRIPEPEVKKTQG